MSVQRHRLVVAALAAVVLFAGGAYALGRSIKRSGEPLPSATPVHIVAERATVRPPGNGPAIPDLRRPTATATRTPRDMTGRTTTGRTTGSTTGPTTATTGPTTTGPTTATTGPTTATTGPSTTGPTTTGPTTTGPTTTGPSTSSTTTTG